MALDHYRELAYYFRLIEHDMPRLVAYRKPFVPPTPSTPVIVRSVHYAGEEHPVTVKRALVVPVSDLPLSSDAARHKIRILAGVRWTPNPPADAGVSGAVGWGDGFIKISCERFPEPAMNMKWASDVLDRLVLEANDPKDTFKNVPVDLRHVYSKLRKSKKGHRRGHFAPPPSIHDFPLEWLPDSASQGEAAGELASS
ncbi:mitochondrial ribosomal subunit protein-domain-containing protein [Pterulicium gracile]|uniref:Mitochondrial ribosomal subunit protein-domain-containing protein n=1 Tax=Pterulicium gracile TaxID=1884261 RepID=A0A5C3QXF1_9AGAR|nr:mitochondrial ribosomal subunit protein-domain-containing protein [Pterula gracilis]